MNISIQPTTAGIEALPPKRPQNVDENLRIAAVELESSFLAEMFKAAGLGKINTGFDGGNQESEFGTFLVRAYAKEIAFAGGIGLAETFLQSMKGEPNDQ
jgi:peptidoglycan hydrolase FlgJ